MSFKVEVWNSASGRGTAWLRIGPRAPYLVNKSERKAVIKALQEFDKPKAALNEKEKK